MAARITRAAEAPAYVAPLHEGVVTNRLQGIEAGPTEAFWVGNSVYPPGSRALTAPTAAETVYVCLAGELVLRVTDGDTQTTTTLYAGDSAHMPRGTVRSVDNESTDDARLLVVIAVPRPD
jgi:quercetin dioxygenase-like cupin family protein